MSESENIKPVSVEIKCDLPFALYVEGEYQVRLSAGTVAVLLQRIRQEHLDPRLGIHSGDFDVREDRYGFVSYLRLILRLNWPIFEELRRQVGGRTDDQVMRGVARIVANHIVDAYRQATKESWIRRVAKSDLFNLEGQLTYADGVVQGIASMGPPQSGVTLPVEGLSEKAQGQFLQNLSSPEPLPLWDNLWLDSEDAVNRGDYQSAIIWGHSALEILSNATILSWLREQRTGVDQAADRLSIKDSHKGLVKNSLSFEELVEGLSDTLKIRLALDKVLNTDPSLSFDLCSRFSYLAAARNEVLHSGIVVSSKEAQEHLVLVRAIRAQLADQSNLERIQSYKALPAKSVLALLKKSSLNQKLVELLDELEAKTIEVTIFSMNKYPIWLHKQTSPVAMIENKGRIRIYLPMRSQLRNVDWELELARLLLRRRMILEEGWPEADISESIKTGKSSLGLINREFYGYIAATITEAVLGPEIARQLDEMGFDILSRTEQQIEEFEKYIGEADFKEPQWGEPDYFLLPVKAVGLELIHPKGSAKLTYSLRSCAPKQADMLQRISEAISRSGWRTPQEAATAILVVKTGLGVLDTIGVRESPKRALRTRFNSEELQCLDGK